MMLRAARLVALATMASVSAVADTAYLEPSAYSPTEGQTVTVEASFNDYCCVPKYPVRSDNYAVIGSDGTSVAPDRLETFATKTILEHRILQSGTTRFTTGERLGRKGEYVLLDGQYRLVNSDDAEPINVPDGTPVLTSQTATLSDTYVTSGDPTWGSLRVPIGRLTMLLEQHPSDLHQGDHLDLVLAFDGEPLVHQSLVVTRSGQRDRPGDHGSAYTSDDKGRVSVPLTDAGTHLLMTRLQAPAPENAETDIRSYTTALTVDVKSVSQ